MQGLPVLELQRLLDFLHIRTETPIGEKDSYRFLNFNSHAEAQAAAHSLHNHPSPIDPACCLRAFIRGPPTSQLPDHVSVAARAFTAATSQPAPSLYQQTSPQPFYHQQPVNPRVPQAGSNEHASRASQAPNSLSVGASAFPRAVIQQQADGPRPSCHQGSSVQQHPTGQGQNGFDPSSTPPRQMQSLYSSQLHQVESPDEPYIIPQQPFQDTQSQNFTAYQGYMQHDANRQYAYLNSHASRPQRPRPSSAPLAPSPRAAHQPGPALQRRPSSASERPTPPPRVFASDCTVVIETSGNGRDLDALLAAWTPPGTLAQAGAVSVSAHMGVAYVNFANAAQAAAAVDMFNSRQHSDISKSPMRQRAVLKSCRDAHQQISQQPYLAQKLKAVDEAHFSAAGLLLVHKPQKGKPEVLLGREIILGGQLTLLGGKRERGESSRITAAREFQEESAYQLQVALHLTPQQGLSLVDRLLADCQVIWLGGSPDGRGNSKYALYIVDIAQGISNLSDLQHLQAQLSDMLQDICISFARFQRRRAWSLSLPSGQREMQSLEWVALSSQHMLAAPLQSMGPFLTKLATGCQPLKEWALDTVTEHMPAQIKAHIKAAQQQAMLEQPSLQAAIAKLKAPVPKPQAPTALTDLVTVQPRSPEYQKIQALISSPLHEIKRVNVPERESRFDAYRLSLPGQHQVISQVIVHSCMPLPHSSSMLSVVSDRSAASWSSLLLHKTSIAIDGLMSTSLVSMSQVMLHILQYTDLSLFT